MDVEAFQDYLYRELAEGGMTDQPLSGEEEAAVRQLRDEKYAFRTWNEGEAPDYTYRNRKRFAGGTLEVRCRVSEGVLREIRFFGDFLSRKEVGELEERLAGQPFVRASIRAVFAECDWENYLGAITREEAEGLLFDEVVW